MKNLFKEVNVKFLQENVFSMLDEEWMLITAGSIGSFNTMTASWGSFGIMWNKPVAICVVRPHRHTFEFINSSPSFTLSFLTEKDKKILDYCGRYSGKHVDKIKETGLVPFETDLKNIGFEQSRLFFECRKLYSDDLKAEHFIDKEIPQQNYPTKDFHRFFIGEIVKCWKK